MGQAAVWRNELRLAHGVLGATAWPSSRSTAAARGSSGLAAPEAEAPAPVTTMAARHHSTRTEGNMTDDRYNTDRPAVKLNT